jgi:hypothetical protein
MNGSVNARLSGREVTALIQIRLQAKLDPKHRGAIARLLHHRLIEERPDGFFVTKAGNERCIAEASTRGLAAPGTGAGR